MARAPQRASSSNGNRCEAGNAEPSGTTSASRVDPSRSNTSSLMATGVASLRGAATWGPARTARRVART